MDFCIGNDILDIGSRRAEAKLRRARDLNELTSPTHFDVPNVANVCICIHTSCKCALCCFIISIFTSSPLCIAVPILLRQVDNRISIKKSSLQKAPLR
jgi:hypothetical protein